MVVIVLDCRASAASREKNKTCDLPWYDPIFILIYVCCIQGKHWKKSRIRTKMTQVPTVVMNFLL